MKKIKYLIPIIITSIMLSACGSSGAANSYQMNNMAFDGGVDYSSNSKSYGQYSDNVEMEETSYDSSSSSSNSNSGNDVKKYSDKLVYTCDLRIQTLVYDDTLLNIREKISSAGGFISSEYEYDNDYRWYYSDNSKTNATRNITITVRVSSDKYDDFLNSLDGDGKIISKSSNVENISRQYYDTEAIIESLNIQEKRLLDMMDKAQTIEEMISVEQRLTEVQTQLNQYKTSLAVMQSDVDYSTVTINLEEVYEYDETIHTNTFFDRLGNTLKNAWRSFGVTLENILFFVIMAIPQIIIFIPIIVIAIIVFNKIKNKIKTKKNKKINNNLNEK